MSFSADWLTMREPVDRRSRGPGLLAALAGVPFPDRVITVVDLGAGTAQAMRHLAGILPRRQRWRLVDGDAGLLRAALTRPLPGAVEDAVPIVLDLAMADLDTLLSGADLVVTTAFLDLVSKTWIDRLAMSIAGLRVPFHASLSVDGRVDWNPADPDDGTIAAAFAADQRRDKGFGPALGPDAVAATLDAFAAAGMRVDSAASDWLLAPGEAAMQLACIEFESAVAARRGVPGWQAWRDRRRAAIAAGRSQLRIGHRDILALPR